MLQEKKAGTVIITATAVGGSNKTATCEITVKPTVTDIVGEMQTSNKTAEDENKNKIVVPGGFKVVPNGIGVVNLYGYQ